MRLKKATFLLFALFLSLPIVSFADAALSLGKGKADITPAAGTPLGGYGKLRKKVAKGIHDRLYARALALTQENETVVFVSADLVLIDEELRAEVLKKIRQKKSLPDASLMLFATHTHTGAGAIGGRFWERFIMGKRRKEIFKLVTDGISESVLQALESRSEASAEYGESDISGLVENRMDEKLNIDHDRLKIIRFKNNTLKTEALLILMAAHPTLAPPHDLLFSADFPGALTHLLEESNEATALFVNGAAADLRPHHEGEFRNRFERIDSYARILQERLFQMEMKPVSLEGPWQAVIEKRKLPRTKIRVGGIPIPSSIGNRFFPRKVNFQAIRMGPMIFLGFPGELAAEIGREIERSAEQKSFMPFLVGYANDYIAYVIPRRHYENRDHYESQVSFYGPKMDGFVRRTVDDLMKRLLSDEEIKTLNPPGELTHQNKLPVLRLEGEAYHRGFEEGRLLQEEIQSAMKNIFRYFRSELPIPLVNRWIINRTLSRAWKKMEPFVNFEEYEEIRGLAEGSGVPLKVMKHLHALPEVYPTWCANGAYWDKATLDGRLIAIRNLDWNRKIGIHNYAAVKFINRHYVNIGYYGFSGVLSGMNKHGISVGQIGATSQDETLKGVPMPFLLKRILEHSETLEDAIAIFKRSDLTRGYNYVIADAREKKAVAIEATRSHLAVFYDDDPKEKEIPYASRIPYAVFRGDPALDPTIRNLQWASKGDPEKPGLEMPTGSAYEIRYKKQGELVLQHFGKIDPEVVKLIAREIAPGSNIQSVIYAYPEFYVANAEGDKRAVENEYVRFNLTE